MNIMIIIISSLSRGAFVKQFAIPLLLGPPWPTAAVFGLSVVVVVVWLWRGGSCSVSQIVPVTTE